MQDWFHVCREDTGLSEKDLKEQHCSRCFQPECHRSLTANDKFTQRTRTWYERLFAEVPRMSEQDPRFVQIRSKKFLDFDGARIPEVGRAQPQSSWVDPRDLDESPPSPQVQSLEEPPPKILEPPPEPQPVEKAPEPPIQQKPPETPPQPEPPPSVVPVQVPANTPFKQGQMLGQQQHVKQKSPRDSWDVPKAPETDGLKVVKPGAKIKLGGSGV